MKDILEKLAAIEQGITEEHDGFYPGDEFGISLSEDFEIETTIVDVVKDGIVIELDDAAIEMLESQGVTFIEVPMFEGNSSIAEKTVYTGYYQKINENNGNLQKMFNHWMSSEYAPMDDDSGDYNAVFSKALNFASDISRSRSDSENLAHQLTKMFNGDLEESDYSSLQDWIGKRVYVKSMGGMGTVSDISQGHRNSVIVDLDNGDMDIVHVADLSMEKPNFMRRMIDKVKAPVAEPAPRRENADLDGNPYEMGYRAAALYNKGKNSNPFEYDDPQHDEWQDGWREGAAEEGLGEAEYQGRKVALGKPMQGDVKKSKVYVRNPKGNVVKVNFGDKKMKIKKSNPKRRKSFRARHNCANPGPRHKARYWSCRAW